MPADKPRTNSSTSLSGKLSASPHHHHHLRLLVSFFWRLLLVFFTSFFPSRFPSFPPHSFALSLGRIVHKASTVSQAAGHPVTRRGLFEVFEDANSRDRTPNEISRCSSSCVFLFSPRPPPPPLLLPPRVPTRFSSSSAAPGCNMLRIRAS